MIERLAVLAQVMSQVTSDNTMLYTYGPLGVFCGWLMWRDEKRAADHRSIGHRLDGLTKALLVDMAERDSCGIQTKKYARAEIEKINARLPR